MQSETHGLLPAQPRDLTEAQILAMMQEPDMRPAPEIDQLSQEAFGGEGHNYLEDTLNRIDQQYTDELLLLQQARVNAEGPEYEFDIGGEFGDGISFIEDKISPLSTFEALAVEYEPIAFVKGVYDEVPKVIQSALTEVSNLLWDGFKYSEIGMLAPESLSSPPKSALFNSLDEYGAVKTAQNMLAGTVDSLRATYNAAYAGNGYELGVNLSGLVVETAFAYGVGKVLRVGNGVDANYGVGDAYNAEFIGPVNWKTFYRGDSTQRSSFNSTYSEVNGLDATYEFMDSLNAGQRRDIQRDHAVSSQYSPTISLTSNKDVATFFATSGGKQSGYVTTFRFDASNPNRVDPNMPYYNFDNRYNMEMQNPELGTSEFEFLADVRVSNRNIYSQERVGVANSANSAGARVLLREDLAYQAGIPRNIIDNPSNVWGASLDQLKYSFIMDGATVENVAARGSKNAQIFNVKDSATGIRQVQYSPSTVDLQSALQSTHVGEYYKLTFNDGSKIKVINTSSYRPTFNRNGQPVYDNRTTYFNSNSQRVIFDPETNTWMPK